MVTLPANQCAGISGRGSNDHTSEKLTLLKNPMGTSAVVFSFALGLDMQQKTITSDIYLNFCTASAHGQTIGIHTLCQEFDENTVKFDNVRHWDEHVDAQGIPDGEGQWVSVKVLDREKHLVGLGGTIQSDWFTDIFSCGILLMPTANTITDIYSTRSANKPYLSFDAKPLKYSLAGGEPENNSFIDSQKSNAFYIKGSLETHIDGLMCYVEPKIDSAYLRWRVLGSSNYTQQYFSGLASDRQLAFPSGTFPAKSKLQWQIQITTTDNIAGDFSSWMDFTTIDSLSTVQPLSPIAVYLVGNEPNTFIWKHVIATGTLQTSAELQTSADGQTWRALQAVNGGVQQGIVPAGVLAGNTRFWRVRTSNRDAVAGQWSEAVHIVVYAAPRPPSVLPPEGTPLLTVTWQSAEQKAYEVKAGDWQSGAIYGTTKIYTFPQWFPDGAMVVGVRVQSELGLWSEWALMGVTVTNHEQSRVQLSARAVRNGVKLSWTGSHAAYTIYRDGIVIHHTTGTGFVDWLTSGKHRYQVRGINGKYYALSNTTVEISASVAGVISDIDTINWLPLRYRCGGSATTSGAVNRQVAMQYLQGRTKPIAEVAEQLTAEHEYEYSFDTPEDAAALERLVGHTVICKNGQCPVVIGILNPASTTSDWGSVDVSFTITETDWKEGREIENL